MSERALEAAAGELPDGPLRGVPVMMKDLGQEIAGVRQTGGSRALLDHIAGHDSEMTAPLPRGRGRVRRQDQLTRVRKPLHVGARGARAVSQPVEPGAHRRRIQRRLGRRGRGRDDRRRRCQRRRRIDPDSGLVLRRVRAEADPIADLGGSRPAATRCSGWPWCTRSPGRCVTAHCCWISPPATPAAIPTSLPPRAGPTATRWEPSRGGCGSAGRPTVSPRRPGGRGGGGGDRGDRAAPGSISATRSSRPRPRSIRPCCRTTC